MDITNIKFSKIDKETLVNYFLNDFKKKEDVEREEHETIFKWLFNLIALFVGFASFVAIVWFVYEPFWNVVKNWYVSDNIVNYLNLSAAIISYVLIFFMLIFWYAKLVQVISAHLFPTSYKLKKQRQLCGKIWHDYWDIIHFQELLKTKDIVKLSANGDSSVMLVEYIGANSITQVKVINLSNHYKNIVKEDCLDFSWFDEVINQELRDTGCKEILVEY